MDGLGPLAGCAIHFHVIHDLSLHHRQGLRQRLHAQADLPDEGHKAANLQIKQLLLCCLRRPFKYAFDAEHALAAGCNISR